MIVSLIFPGAVVFAVLPLHALSVQHATSKILMTLRLDRLPVGFNHKKTFGRQLCCSEGNAYCRYARQSVNKPRLKIRPAFSRTHAHRSRHLWMGEDANASHHTDQLIDEVACLARAGHAGEDGSNLSTGAEAATSTSGGSAVFESQPLMPEARLVPMWQALFALNTAAVLWGSQHAVMKDFVDFASPSLLNAGRFAIAAAVAIPWLPRQPGDEPPSPLVLKAGRSEGDDAGPSERASATWVLARELGLWTFLGFTLQTVGLQYTSASRSAFLLYLNVKLVPLLALMLYGERSGARTWASAALALGGTALMSFDGGPPNAGDAWSLCAALASACFILRLGESAPLRLRPSEVNAATLICAAGYFWVWAAADTVLNSADGDFVVEQLRSGAAHWQSLLYLSLVASTAASWLQALGQSRVRPQDAAIIYSLDPVYGAAFSYALLGERLGTQGLIGIGVILSGVALSRWGGEDVIEDDGKGSSDGS